MNKRKATIIICSKIRLLPPPVLGQFGQDLDRVEELVVVVLVVLDVLFLLLLVLLLLLGGPLAPEDPLAQDRRTPSAEGQCRVKSWFLMYNASLLSSVVYSPAVV
jgi:hypothetical protein